MSSEMKVSIHASSELMKNQKQAALISPQKTFQALQSVEGYSLFFSIGDDDVMYLSREAPGTSSGWVRSDLTSSLKEQNAGNPVKAVTFNVSQSIKTGTVDIVLGLWVSDDENHRLYTAIGLANTVDTWSQPIPWELQTFDDTEHPIEKLRVANLYVSQNKKTQYTVADVFDDATSNKFVRRFFIDQKKKVSGKVWNWHDLPANLNAEDIHSVMGRAEKQLVDGMYTFGQINGKQELIYRALYNAFDPDLAPTAILLPVVQTKAAMTAGVTASEKGYTAVFVAGDGQLSYWECDQQKHEQPAQVALSSSLFFNVTRLHCASTSSLLALWGLNQQGQLFYTQSELGSSGLAGGFTEPMVILTGVTQFTPFVNATQNNHVLFAHLDGSNVMQLTQNPETSLWDTRHILLPSTDVDDVVEFTTFTTHVQLLREDNFPETGTVEITSVSPISLYVNNQFTILSPFLPAVVAVDETGSITLVQPTDGLSAVPYNLKLHGTEEVINVNPMLKVLDKVATIQSGDDLGAVTVTDEHGNEQPLVGSDVSSDDKDAAAAALQQLVKAGKDVPEDGSKKKGKSIARMAASEFEVSDDTVWGISYEDGCHKYHSGHSAMERFGLKPDPDTGLMSVQRGAMRLNLGDAVSAAAGDVWNWVKGAWDDVKNFFVKVYDGVSHFFITLGDRLYTFILDTVAVIMSAIEFILNKIMVFLTMLIKWLGFLFGWDDILRTKNAIKGVVRATIQSTLDSIDKLKAGVVTTFTSLKEQIDAWAGFDAPDKNLSSDAKDYGQPQGTYDPQSQYGNYHAQNGLRDASQDVDDDGNAVMNILQTLLDAVEREGEIFAEAFNKLKSEVIDQITTLSFVEIAKRVMAIVADILVESVENLCVTMLDIVKEVVQGIFDLLDSTIHIPVLSWLYKLITGSDLTMFDLAALVVAIPTTIIYKIAHGETPFPDNDATGKIINAKTLDDIRAATNPPTSTTGARLMAAEEDTCASSAARSSMARDGPSAEWLRFVRGMRILSGFSAIVFIGANIAKREAPRSKQDSIMHGVWFYMTTGSALIGNLIAGEGNQPGWVIAGEVVYGLTCLQKLADIFTYRPGMDSWKTCSAWIDMLLGAAGLIVSCVAIGYNHTGPAIANFVGAVAWNCNRMASPFAKDPRVFAGKQALILVYSVSQFTAAGLT